MGYLKKPSCVVALVMLLFHINGQAQFLPFSQSGKCEMAEVVLADGFSKSILFGNEVRWVKGLTRNEGKLNSVVKDSIEGKVSGNFEFPVYAQSGILRKVAGAISYHFTVETKDGKYRYAFTDFVFHYYKQDRNYKMVKTGRTKPLEEVEAPGWQRLWTHHRGTVSSLVTHQIADLKTTIVETPDTANNKPAEKKIDW